MKEASEIKAIVKKHGLWLTGNKAGSRVDLPGADLARANLAGANLSEGIKIVSVSGIGSSRRLTNYRIDTDEVWCGCFKSTFAGFEKRVKETHKKNQQHLADYKAAIAFFKVAKKSHAAMNGGE